MKKYSLLAVSLLLMCNVSVCGQTGRILLWIQHSLRKQICNEYIIPRLLFGQSCIEG